MTENKEGEEILIKSANSAVIFSRINLVDWLGIEGSDLNIALIAGCIDQKVLRAKARQTRLLLSLSYKNPLSRVPVLGTLIDRCHKWETDELSKAEKEHQAILELCADSLQQRMEKLGQDPAELRRAQLLEVAINNLTAQALTTKPTGLRVDFRISKQNLSGWAVQWRSRLLDTTQTETELEA